MKTGLLLSLVLAASAFAQQAELKPAPEPFEKGQETDVFSEDLNAPKVIQTTVELIEVPFAEATRMLYREKLGKEGDKLRAELQKLVDEGKATMLDTLFVTSRSSQKSTAESIREVIYPTEYEPAEIPAEVSVDKETAVTPEKIKLLEALMTPATPTAFETRNTGGTLEVEPTLSEDGRIIDLRLVPELVFDTGRQIYHKRKDSLGNESTIEMPLFYSMRTNTAVSLYDGQSQLISVLSPKSAEGPMDPTRKVFVIVRCDVVTVKANK